MAELNDKNDSHKKHLLKLLSDLHDSSNSVVFKALSQLRVDAFKNKSADKYLCEINAFKVLVKFLKLPNDKILNLTLSILANSSLKDDCRKQIGELGVVVPLVSILKHIVQDQIQNRACRLAANLALSKDIAVELIENRIVPAIVSIIDTSKSSGTHQSGIRALRILWESSNNHNTTCISIKDLMLAEGVVKSVASKFVSDNKEVVENALKTVALFSEHSPIICAKQLRLVEDNGFSLLLSKLPNPSGHQIIYNLCRCSPGVHYLNECHAVKVIAELLSATENQREKLLIYSLCLLCNDSSGSMQLLTSENGLNVFLCLLQQAETYNIKSKLYHVLLRFVFEPRTLLSLTNFGLVKILINKLDSFISSYGKPHGSTEDRNGTKDEDKWLRQVVQTPSSPTLDLNFSTKNKNKFSFSSPVHSGASPYSSSSGSLSPCHSPRSLSPPLSDSSSPMAVYSPVCSISDDDEDNFMDADKDDSDNEDEDMNGDSDRVTRSSKLFPDPEGNVCEQNDVIPGMAAVCSLGADTAKEPVREDASIVYILFKLSHIDGNVDDLAAERTIKTLIKYLVLIKHMPANSHVVSFFRSLVIKERYYCDLLDNQFALEVQRMLCRPVHARCSRCDELNETGDYILEASSKLSEAGLGEGQMAYRLLTGQDDVKLQVALTIAHVTRDASLLLKLLFKYKAMDLMIDRLMLYNEIESTSVEDVAYSLKTLFVKLNFENPQQKNTSNHRCVGCDVGKLRRESSIAFSLDDGTIVPANKTSLCTNSPVFEAMLNGNFKESDQHEVKICDVSEKCLQHFVKLIDTYCECILPNDVNVLLELISISDRYLVSKLMNNILVYIMDYILNYKNCHIIFKWAKECKLPFSEKICNDVIKYMFTAKISCKQLRKALVLMMEGIHKDVFISDIIEMIKDALHRESRKKIRR